MHKYGKEIESLLDDCRLHIAGVVDNAIVQSKIRTTENLISFMEDKREYYFLFSMENRLEYVSFMVDDHNKEIEGRKISGEIINFFEDTERAHLPYEPLSTSMISRFGSASTWEEVAAYSAGSQRPPLGPTGTPTPSRLPEPSKMTPLRLANEFFASPIFCSDPSRIGHVEIDDLPVSASLKLALKAWDAAYQATYNDSYPPESGFHSSKLQEVHCKRGEELAERLQTELGDMFRIEYQR
ncbi:hypothetical protein [Asaia bogorensis]|uniref:hypothetical protein n=1 Tax=Asaia bogorensis TaxID=91915 RepID=UPI002860CFEE|nr:hypothetical protein [Asaia bogorensis]MDR6182161.1 hypothetical protein [Asaia bogorensis NBRC 16594]